MSGNVSSKGMQVLNWGVMGISFALLAATSVFGMEVLDKFCANMQYDGTTDDIVSEESFTRWDQVMWGGLGAGIAPAITLVMLLLVQLLCTKSPFWSASAVTCGLTALLAATSFGLTSTTRIQGLFCGMFVGMIMMILVVAPTMKTVTAGSVMVQVGTAFLIFGGLSTALGAFALGRVGPCNAHRGCLPADTEPATAPAPADGEPVNPFTTVCDWSCCDVKSPSTACAEYAADTVDACGDCQPCLIDSTISTKLWACTGTGIALTVIALILLIVRFAAPVP
jgi:hypothetical protein